MTTRISFDHQTFELQPYGGISRYFCELAVRLATMPSCSVNIIAPLHVNEYLRSVPPSIQKVACYVGRVPKIRRITRAVNNFVAPTLLRRQRPDIVHRTYYAAGQAPVPGARTVITVYDMIHERFHQQMAHLKDAPGKREAISAANHIICISESTRRDLIEIFDVNPAKTSVVYLGFDLMSGNDSLEVAMPDREFLLYVGRRSGYKNFDGLLAAYSASPRLHENFDIVCFGGGPFDADEKAAIATASSRDGAVKQIGGSDAILRHLYQRAAVFIYPSLYEGFGIPPLEAMNFDCPVVCCPVSSIPEVVGSAASFFEPGDAGSLVEAIEKVVDDAAYRANLIQLGHERLKLFSWQRCAEQTLDVYEKVLA